MIHGALVAALSMASCATAPVFQKLRRAGVDSEKNFVLLAFGLACPAKIGNSGVPVAEFDLYVGQVAFLGKLSSSAVRPSTPEDCSDMSLRPGPKRLANVYIHNGRQKINFET